MREKLETEVREKVEHRKQKVESRNKRIKRQKLKIKKFNKQSSY